MEFVIPIFCANLVVALIALIGRRKRWVHALSRVFLWLNAIILLLFAILGVAVLVGGASATALTVPLAGLFFIGGQFAALLLIYRGRRRRRSGASRHVSQTGSRG